MYSLNKRSKTLKIIGIVLIILFLSTVALGVILYFTTDFFKSDEEIFQRQFLQNVNVINGFIDITQENEYTKILGENNYKETTTLGFSYVNNDGKEEKFTSNIVGTNDKENNKSYKDINIEYGNTNVMKLTYLKESDIYGIRFLEGTKFAVIDTTNNITPVLKYFGIDDIISSEKINIVDLSDVLNLSKSEIEQFEKQYLSIILQNITEEDYSSQKGQIVKLDNNQEIKANSYILTIQPEQFKNIYKGILNELSKDEIILKRLENIDNKIKELGINIEKNIKTTYLDSINEKLDDINIKSGIVVTLYEMDGNTVRTTIEYQDKIFNLDISNSRDIIIKYSDKASENAEKLTLSIKKDADKTQLNYEDNANNKIELIRYLNIDNNDIISVTDFKYSDANNIKDLEISIDRIIKVGEKDEIPTSFEKSGKVLLNDYDYDSTYENLQALRNRIIKLLRQKRDETNSEFLSNIIEYNNQLEENKKNEDENKRKKFNSKFELYEGENLEKSIVLNLLDEAGKNMLNYEIISEGLIKVIIEEGKNNKELVSEIKSKLDQEEYEVMYNIDLKYDENAKINEIIIEKVIEE